MLYDLNILFTKKWVARIYVINMNLRIQIPEKNSEYISRNKIQINVLN